MLQRSAFQTVGEDVRDSADIWDCRTGRKGPTNNTLDNYTYGMQSVLETLTYLRERELVVGGKLVYIDTSGITIVWNGCRVAAPVRVDGGGSNDGMLSVSSLLMLCKT
jgi:hypothetical protein